MKSGERISWNQEVYLFPTFFGNEVFMYKGKIIAWYNNYEGKVDVEIDQTVHIHRGSEISNGTIDEVDLRGTMEVSGVRIYELSDYNEVWDRYLTTKPRETGEEGQNA